MIKIATLSDLDIPADLAAMLWDNHTIESLKTEFLETIPKNDSVFFLVFEEQAPVRFAHCQLRNDYVEGTETSPVGCLEGIFIKEDFRSKGYAKNYCTNVKNGQFLKAVTNLPATVNLAMKQADCFISIQNLKK